jgi:alanine racemase
MRATVAVINTNNLINNFKTIKAIAPKSQVMPIVKANAYGHGITEVSKILESAGANSFGVAFADEGIVIREAGIKIPIVVLVPTFPDEAQKFVEYDIQASVSSCDFMKALSEEAVKSGKTAKVHLCIGTGMNREGIQPGDAVQFMKKCAVLPNIEFIAACTHFATSSTDPAFVKRQLRLFNETLDNLKNAGFTFKHLHAANTGAIVNHPEAHFTIVRPGISIYGYTPVPEMANKLNVKPVLSLKTKIVMTRRIREGESVSYDRLYVSREPSTIATLPVGYGDGFFKSLTGKAQCLIKGKVYDIVGSICMDECMVDVGDDNVQTGYDVILIGAQGNKSILVPDVAHKAGTIPYEVLTAISARVPRVYIEE